MAPISWKNDTLTAKDILQLPKIPKYLKIDYVDEQMDGLSPGVVFNIASVFSEPCIRCKFFSKDGSLHYIFGQEGINIPLCYPDYIVNIQSDHYFCSVDSLSKHAPRQVQTTHNNNPLLKKLPYFQRNEFEAKDVSEGMLALENTDHKTVFLPLELDMEFKEFNDNESLTLKDFVNRDLCPQYVKFLNWSLAQDIFQIDIRDMFAEVQYVFDQRLFICKPLESDDTDNGPVFDRGNIQWAFTESHYKSTFYISEEYNDVQSISSILKSDIKTTVEMVNAIKTCEQTESSRLTLNQNNIIQSPNEPIKWSTKMYPLSLVIKNASQIPKYLKLANDSEGKSKSDHEFLFKSNDICEIVDIKKGECMRVRFSEHMNIPLSYPYLILDTPKDNNNKRLAGTVGSTEFDVINEIDSNCYLNALVKFDSLKLKGKSQKEVKILEKEGNENNTFRYLRHSSDYKFIFEDKKFDQSYVTLKVSQGTNNHTVLVPTTRCAQSKLQFFISDNHSIDIEVNNFETTFANEAIKTAGSNFPIDVQRILGIAQNLEKNELLAGDFPIYVNSEI